MFTIIVTEKPSVAQEYIKTLKIKEKREVGYVRGQSEVLGKEVAVTWCIGHLCALSYPERYDEALKKWTSEVDYEGWEGKREKRNRHSFLNMLFLYSDGYEVM